MDNKFTYNQYHRPSLRLHITSWEM